MPRLDQSPLRVHTLPDQGIDAIGGAFFSYHFPRTDIYLWGASQGHVGS